MARVSKITVGVFKEWERMAEERGADIERSGLHAYAVVQDQGGFIVGEWDEARGVGYLEDRV